MSFCVSCDANTATEAGTNDQFSCSVALVQAGDLSLQVLRSSSSIYDDARSMAARDDHPQHSPKFANVHTEAPAIQWIVAHRTAHA